MAYNTFITRELGIDAGHRVTNHHSKCKNLHGHRYRIEVALVGDLVSTPGSPAEGMVLDFGDVKDILRRAIEDPFDHVLILWMHDPLVEDWTSRSMLRETLETTAFTDIVGARLENEGYYSDTYRGIGKVAIMARTPTAENLAALWYHLVRRELHGYDELTLESVRVWETPNCSALYPAG